MNLVTVNGFVDELEKIAISDELAGRAFAMRSLKNQRLAGNKVTGLAGWHPKAMKTSLDTIASPKGQLHIRRSSNVTDVGKYLKGAGDIASANGNRIGGAITRLIGKGFSKLK